MNVFVTGSSSCLAQALLPVLCAHPEISGITGVDLKPPRFRHGKFLAWQMDIRDPRSLSMLAGNDALVHLAFVVLRGRMSARCMERINVAAGLALLKAARRAGVKRLVHVSSAAVYGSGEALKESAPLNPLPGFLYALHKAELERRLEAEIPDCVRLRPHVILGPNSQPLLKRLLNQPFFVPLPDPQPQLQCVHEDDVAQAILFSLLSDARGAFNLAADGSFSFREAVGQRHEVPFPVPHAFARLALSAAWRLTGWGGEPAWIEGIARTLTLDCKRAKELLGWAPRYSVAETLDSVRRVNGEKS